jgi:hypothetical protein
MLQAVSASAKVLNGEPMTLTAPVRAERGRHEATTPAEAGAGRTGKGDDERNVSAARYPYVQVFDDLMELHRHTQQTYLSSYPRHVNFMPCGPIRLVFPIFFHKPRLVGRFLLAATRNRLHRQTIPCLCGRPLGGFVMTEPAFIFSTQCYVLDYLAEAEMAHSAGQSAHPNLLVREIAP